MARLSGTGFSGKKAKLGTTIRETSLSALQEFQQRHSSVLRSPGEVVDYLIDTFLAIDGQTAAELYDFCRSKEEAIVGERAGVASSEPMAMQALDERFKNYASIGEHMSYFAGSEFMAGNRTPMRRVDMADGAYAVFPDDWMIVNPNDASSRSHACVFEIKNGAAIGAPHFVFFTDIAASKMDSSAVEEMVSRASGLWPEIAEIRKKEVKPAYDREGRILNFEEWRDSLRVGLFELLDSTEYVGGKKPPAGAVVYRQ